MKIITFLWQEFKSRPDEWFFYAFLLSFPLSIRKILYFVPIEGGYNEFASISLYVSDIFLIAAICARLIILYNNNIVLSSSNDEVNIVPRGTIFKVSVFFEKIYTQLVHNYILILPLIIVILSFLSTAWAQDVYLATFRSFKLLEFYLLFLYVYHKLFHPSTNVPRGTSCGAGVEQFSKSNLLNERDSFDTNDENFQLQKDCSTWNNLENGRGTFVRRIFLVIVLFGLFQALVVFFQILAQKSIGLFWLKESIFSADMTGVAKIVFNGETLVRPYGLLPHPNVLGGFLVFTTICTLIYFKLFHVEQFEVKKENNCSTWNNSNFKNKNSKSLQKKCSTWNIFEYRAQDIVPRGTIQGVIKKPLFHVEQWFKKPLLKWLIYAVQISAIICTFSKSAVFGLILAIFYILYKNSNILTDLPRNNCSTWNNPEFQARNNVPRGTLLDNMRKVMFHVEQFIKKISQLLFNITKANKKIFLGIAIVTTVFVLFKPNYHSLIGRSISDRLIFLNVSRGTFIEHPFLGVGAGQYVINLLSLDNVLEWQYEPVHNVFLLILNELGIIALVVFLVFVYKLFRNANCSTWNNLENKCGISILGEATVYIKGLCIALIVIMLFDHYLWTIQQGQIILWFTLAMLAAVVIRKR
ncbi:MAG TPA: hypothetical protein DCX32_03410 [Candidatus Moranbacteria bacterium]|nr:MAG: hypothetical protein UW95_C0024G0018 [Parcubacteria group bacterium GW2011_GWC1_45_14]HAV11567.1 hypothetical protein [Candidatus Moranbacteria bacterium]